VSVHNLLLSAARAELVAVFVLWLKVMYHYGGAARAEWYVQGGRKGKILAEIFHPFWWAYRTFLSKFGLAKPFPKSAYETYTPYTPGVILRFAIFAGALGPVLAVGRLFTEPLNSPITTSTLILSVVLFLTSMFGALMHLYVAHRQRPFRWMWIAVLTSLWLPLGTLAFYQLLPTVIIPPSVVPVSYP